MVVFQILFVIVGTATLCPVFGFVAYNVSKCVMELQRSQPLYKRSSNRKFCWPEFEHQQYMAKIKKRRLRRQRFLRLIGR